MGAPYRLDQLDEEIRVALGLAQKLGLTWDGRAWYPAPVGSPGVASYTRADGTIDATGWTDVQRTAFVAACDAHVASPLFGELNDIRICRLYVGDATLDNLLTLADGTLTAAQRDFAIKNTIRAVRALMRVVRNLAT